MTFADLFRNVENVRFPEQWERLKNSDVVGLSHHSGMLKPGELFIAIPGFEHDGHSYLENAREAGAVGAVVEHEDNKVQLPQFVVENSRKAQAELACNFYSHPSKELTLCGITGSNGKTTTSLMLQSILEAAGEKSGIIGTVAYRTGKSEVESKLTTPDSVDLQRYLREMVDSQYRFAVMEVSSIGQTQYRAHGSHFRVAAFINLGREHLDFHGGMEEYFAAKKTLFRQLTEEAVAVINQDDEYANRLRGETKAKIISFGLSEEADVRAYDIDLSSGFAKAKLSIKDTLPHAGIYDLLLSVPGMHSLMNALAAITCGLALGFTAENCIQGIQEYLGVERRFQEIYNGKYRIFDDHFANAGNIDLTLETLSKMEYERLFIAYAIRGKRGVTVNRENVEALLKWIPQLRLAGFVASRSKDTVGHYDEVLPEEEAVFHESMQKGQIDYTTTDTLEEAVLHQLARCEEGDLLLLAGCQGMDAGGRIALQYLAKKDPERSEEILAPLRDRVCGW